MPEKFRPEFGVPYFSEQRVSSASEAITRSFVYRFADTDESWKETEGFFPEYTDKIRAIRSLKERRQNLLSHSEREEDSSNISRASKVLDRIQGITRFPYAFQSAVVVSRLFPEVLPEALDSDTEARVLKEADRMILETNGAVRDQGRLTEFIALILKDKVRLGPRVPTRRVTDPQLKLMLY